SRCISYYAIAAAFRNLWQKERFLPPISLILESIRKSELHIQFAFKLYVDLSARVIEAKKNLLYNEARREQETQRKADVLRRAPEILPASHGSNGVDSEYSGA